jgi:hypothetical protein
MSDDGSDYDSDEHIPWGQNIRRDYRVRPGHGDIFSSFRYMPLDRRCERNVQIYRAPCKSGRRNLYYYRTNIQRIPSQIRLNGRYLDVCRRIATLATDRTFRQVTAKCLCGPCDDDATWDDPQPISCNECSAACTVPTCDGYRRCSFHFCNCGRLGRYNLRSGRR